MEKKSPFRSPEERDEYFAMAIAFEQKVVDEANVSIDYFRKLKPGGSPGWGYHDTAAGIRESLQRTKRTRFDALKKLKKLRAGIPLFVTKV